MDEEKGPGARNAGAFALSVAQMNPSLVSIF